MNRDALAAYIYNERARRGHNAITAIPDGALVQRSLAAIRDRFGDTIHLRS